MLDPSKHALANDQLDEMDRWMLERTADLVKKCREWYAAYEFHRVYHAIHDYCIVDLSAFYYDVLKDRLYTKAPSNKSRRSAQTAVWKITGALVRLLAPILVFTSEESWKYLPHAAGEPASVHIAEFPQEAELRTGLAPEPGSEAEARLARRIDRLATSVSDLLPDEVAAARSDVAAERTRFESGPVAKALSGLAHALSPGAQNSSGRAIAEWRG